MKPCSFRLDKLSILELQFVAGHTILLIIHRLSAMAWLALKFTFVMLCGVLVSVISAQSCEVNDEISDFQVQYKEGFWFPQDKTIFPGHYTELVALPPREYGREASLKCGDDRIMFKFVASTTESIANTKLHPWDIIEFNQFSYGKYIVFQTKNRSGQSGSSSQRLQFCLPGSTYQRSPALLPAAHDTGAYNYIFKCKVNAFKVEFKALRVESNSSLLDYCVMSARPRDSERPYYFIATIQNAGCDFDEPEYMLRVFSKLFSSLEIL